MGPYGWRNPFLRSPLPRPPAAPAGVSRPERPAGQDRPAGGEAEARRPGAPAPSRP
ncbi:hypothetical protein GCM10009530_70610 [Microbispora corallina]|uniref:Uncharacterized protein n=2 Tax=Microbispora corallina TaxID=83302 RepID=A0ABQ4GB75_9ACTN|nr:hypothetical protein Mco01_72870 [Microbispora corallina]